MSVVSAQNLVKRYGSVRALDGFSMRLEPGRIVGLIGPNGSGKTTALNALLGLCSCNSGELSVLGLNPREDRAELMQRVSYVSDTGILPRWMKVRDLIRYVGDVQPAFSADRARATLAGTSVSLNQRVRTLSKGLAVQLHLALVLATDTELMVLDEPTLGLDLIYRQTFYDQLLRDYATDERSIVITTHEVAEVERILTDVVFIHDGRVVLDSPMDELQRRFLSVTTTPDQQPVLAALNPVSVRRTLSGVTAIFDGVQTEQLEKIGDVGYPSLADLFVALLSTERGTERKPENNESKAELGL